MNSSANSASYDPPPRSTHIRTWARRDPDDYYPEADPDIIDHTKSAWLAMRLQELRGTPRLRLSVQPAAVPRRGWLLLLLLPLSVRIPTAEADTLVHRLVKKRNAPQHGIWRPCDEEIIAEACDLPDGEPLGRTLELLKSANFRPARATECGPLQPPSSPDTSHSVAA